MSPVPIRLSPSFTLDEFLRSETAAKVGRQVNLVSGSPVHLALERLCREILEPLRQALGPVTVTSGYRPPWLNVLIGIEPWNPHTVGCAADIVVAGHTPLEVCRWVEASGLPYDQVLYEMGRWTHVSIAADGFPRREALTGYEKGGKIAWLRGLHEVEVPT